MTVKVRDTERKVFLQDGFYHNIRSSIRLHKHKYADVHIVLDVRSKFVVGRETFYLEPGSVILIPKDVYHLCENTEDGGRHIAFQIEYEANDMIICPVEMAVAECLFAEIAKQGIGGDHTKISLYLALVVSEFCR